MENAELWLVSGAVVMTMGYAVPEVSSPRIR
jgi:hypothetical protein